MPRGPQIESVLAEVQPDSAAQKAGLQAGDRIVKVDGQPLGRWQTLVKRIHDGPGNRWLWRLKETAPLVLTLIPDTKPVGKDKSVGLQASFKVLPLPDEYKTIRQYGPFPALYQAGDKTAADAADG